MKYFPQNYINSELCFGRRQKIFADCCLMYSEVIWIAMVTTLLAWASDRGQGDLPPRILKFDIFANNVFLSFTELVKWNFTTVGHPWENPLLPQPTKNAQQRCWRRRNDRFHVQASKSETTQANNAIAQFYCFSLIGYERIRASRSNEGKRSKNATKW